MMESPLITVSIAAYNRLPLLKRCLKSVLSQQSNDFNILVVDDGSDEDTKAWLRSLESRVAIRIVYQNNMGVARARQVCLELSDGKYVLVLDSDDELAPGALSIVANRLASKPSVDLMYCNNHEVYPNGTVRFSNYPFFSNCNDLIKAILNSPRVPYKHSGTVIRRSFALAVGGYTLNLGVKIDIDFILKLLKNAPVVEFIKDPIILFNFHKNSISRQKRLQGIITWKIIIQKYGSENKIMNYFLLLKRSMFEVGKLIYEFIVLKFF